MSNDYFPVLLQFSSTAVELGFAGERCPHIILRHDHPLWKKYVPQLGTCTFPRYLGLESRVLQSADRVAFEKLAEEKYAEILKRYRSDFEQKLWVDWAQDMYFSLVRVVKYLLHLSLLISPLKCKLFVIDSGIAAIDKSRFCLAVIGSQCAILVTFIPCSPCIAIGAGLENALLVNREWELLEVVAVVEWRRVWLKLYFDVSQEGLRYATDEYKENENILIGEHIMEAIDLLDVHIRANCRENIVFCNIPEPVASLVTKSHPGLVARASLGVWTGASIYCSTTLLRQDRVNWKKLEITREKIQSMALHERGF